MYFQPYGDEQQLNLNWIINEIINLHKQLDPDYETPSFTQVYPYSNLNRLNLDWILSELKALKELAPEPTPIADIQAVAEALVALPFDSNTSYQIYDFISRDGEIWRATEAIPAGGEWDSTKWFKTKLGTDLAVLERWINTINNSLSGEIEARQNADTTLQTNIDNEALARQQADTALQNAISGLTSANISDDSDAGGATVKESFNNLKSSLNTLENLSNSYESAFAIVADGNTHPSINIARYVFIKNHDTLATGLYKTKEAIPANGILSSTNVSPVSNGGLNAIGADITLFRGTANTNFCSNANVYGYTLGKIFFLSGWFKLSTAPTNNSDIIISGLPKFAFNQTVLVFDEVANTFRTLYAADGSTNLKKGSGTDYTGLTGHTLNILGAYLVSV